MCICKVFVYLPCLLLLFAIVLLCLFVIQLPVPKIYCNHVMTSMQGEVVVGRRRLSRCRACLVESYWSLAIRSHVMHTHIVFFLPVSHHCVVVTYSCF